MHQEILESLETAVALLSQDRVIRYMNPAAGELLGVSVRRIQGTPILSLMSDVDAQLLAHQLTS